MRPLTAESAAGAVWREVIRLPVAQEYRDAFESATGLCFRYLDAADATDLERVSGPFCGLAGPENTRPIACPRKVRLLRRGPFNDGTVMCVCCVAAVTEVVVPVTMGRHHVGSLLVGPFCLRSPTRRDDAALAARWRERNPGPGASLPDRLREALLALPVIEAKRCRAAMVLARTFAQYLSECGNRMLLESAAAGSPLLQRIERELNTNDRDAFSLCVLGRRVGMSPFHLCRTFKKQTGMTLTQYRLRRRIETAKTLLLDGRRRICEAAFAAGFESLPHFNRVFRRLVGCAPTAFRRREGRAIKAARSAIQA